jgi:hypothetical protein
LTGEYYVLAQLAQRGLVGCLTLGHTKGIDILVCDAESGKVTKVEVKTTTVKHPLKRALWLGEGRFFCWRMNEKHAASVSDLVYCFVALGAPTTLPRFFLAPGPAVAEYVHWQHERWRAAQEDREGHGAAGVVNRGGGSARLPRQL